MHDLPQGLKLIALYRRSKQKQHESIERQKELVRMLMQRIGAIPYDEVVLDDHSSTLGEQWEAYYQIIERKRNGEQFDGVCASELSRIGRNMDDCEEYARKLKRAKLKLITHKEGSLIGRDKWLTRIGASHGNEKYAESVSINMNGGIMGLMKRGILPHVQVPIFGIDRMHMSMISGKPLFRLRWTPEKSVLRLLPDDPAAENTICVYEGTTRDDYPRRQRDEKVVLVPGDETQLEVVRQIFRLRYVKDCGYCEIADILNGECKKSPTGVPWEFYSVRAILHNEAYTGIGVCCKTGCGIFSWRHETGPKTFDLPRDRGENAKGIERQNVETVLRPVEDWFVVRCPALRPILGTKLRRLAKAANSKRRHLPLQMHRVEGIRRSAFFLSGLIREANTDAKMWGITTKVVAGVAYRYYRADSSGEKRSEVKKLVVKTLHADLAEAAFGQIVRTLLTKQRDTADRLARILKARMEDRTRNTHLSKLLDERKAAQRRLDLILSVDARYRKNLESDAKKLQRRLEQLDAEIAAARQTSDLTDEAEIPRLVKSVMKRLNDSAEVISLGTTRERSRLARLLLRGIEFDGMTGIVTFHLRLPALFVHNPELMQDLFWSAVTARTIGNGTPKKTTDLLLGEYRFQLHPGSKMCPATIEFLGVTLPKKVA